MSGVDLINMGGVNCCLLSCDDGGFILVDNGDESMRGKLEKRLSEAGCRPGNLKLVILTHGDVDHIANTAYLCEKYGAKVALHPVDEEMARTGDMSLNRKEKPDRYFTLFRLVSMLVKATKADAFQTDIYLEEGYDLLPFGLDASVIETPGHSPGSISVLTGGGDLICGDLLMNFWGPDYHFFIDDMQAARDSVDRLRRMPVKTVYPGHGRPFAFERFQKDKMT